MQTGEDSTGLRKIADLTRLLSISLLLIHFYLVCFAVFHAWGLAPALVLRLLENLIRMELFQVPWKTKCGVLLLLLISLMGVRGKKDEKVSTREIWICMLCGLVFFWISGLVLVSGMEPLMRAMLYMGLTGLGYILVLTGGSRLSRLLKLKLGTDIFNCENETFPQEERLLDNEYSFNLPARYWLKKKERASWINVINPFRGTLIAGTPGSGKSYFVIRHIIDQHIRKGFSLFIYDFKFDDLSRIAYNKLLQYGHLYPVKPKFYVIDFDRILHRGNPLLPETMLDITDATESSRTFMLGLNREWIKRQGDFFVESPINFVTALIWFLRKYQNGKYCTLPHVIELAQVEYKSLFAVLSKEPEIEVLINPFISAWKNEAYDQLEGQIASAKISMARLSSPALYYVLSGNDFSLDLNNPEDPKIICMGNNPQKQQVYGAVLSLYISRMIKMVNQKGKQKCSLIFDEFPTIYFNHIDYLIATARSNKVATTLAVQDYSQLKKDYGREQAEVIMNIVGNIISGQVTGDTAKTLSERFGKIMQQRESVSVNGSDTSISRSMQLDHAIPASKIAALSSGEFVGMVADDPDNKIALKVFHSEIQNDHEAISREEAGYRPLPPVRTVTPEMIQENYRLIKMDIEQLIADEVK